MNTCSGLIPAQRGEVIFPHLAMGHAAAPCRNLSPRVSDGSRTEGHPPLCHLLMVYKGKQLSMPEGHSQLMEKLCPEAVWQDFQSNFS